MFLLCWPTLAPLAHFVLQSALLACDRFCTTCSVKIAQITTEAERTVSSFASLTGSFLRVFLGGGCGGAYEVIGQVKEEY